MNILGLRFSVRVEVPVSTAMELNSDSLILDIEGGDVEMNIGTALSMHLQQDVLEMETGNTNIMTLEICE